MITQDITRFEFDSQELRTATVDGETLFCGKDVCTILGYTNPSKALGDHTKGVTKRYPLETAGGTQEFTFITEPDLYRLITHSKLPTAARFEKWVFEEVLPTIRRTGHYGDMEAAWRAITTPDAIIQMAENWKKDRDARLALEAKAEADAPKILFAEAVAGTQETILVGDLAKILRGMGVLIGQNRLFQILRDEHYLCSTPGDRWNMPTQKSMELGLFRIKESLVVGADGLNRLTKTPKVTGKGQQYFINKFCRAVA
ncbi:phage antirepressor [Mobiluncus porci]|uniref:Phage repressor protein/antirepressor Ant n=1 Tax=Mobiluncus porci TaxID=2652278 RepID=A0A7K0K0F7_9ACTO|nr:phage antirepressor [Mobiluncus porci]MST48899.1 phage repressor protein/antirepressor Ant [Mobiluncus porci]